MGEMEWGGVIIGKMLRLLATNPHKTHLSSLLLVKTFRKRRFQL